jgi:hypothetical protein
VESALFGEFNCG